MNFVFLNFIFLSSMLNAKVPQDITKYSCKSRVSTKESDAVATQPLLLHQTSNGPVIGICGTAEAASNNKVSAKYKNFKLSFFDKNFVFSNTLIENSDKDKKFIAIETKNGIVLIESYLDSELFKHTISCSESACKIEKETCIHPKAKEADVKNKIKNKEIIKRLKKLGCLKK